MGCACGGSKASLAGLRRFLILQGVDVEALWVRIERLILKTLYCVQVNIPCVSSFVD